MSNSKNISNPINYPLTTLEFEQIRIHIAALTVSQSGQELLLSAEPFKDVNLLKESLDRITEMKALLSYDEVLPLQSFADLRISLKKAEVDGAFLQPGEFQDILVLMMMARQIHVFFESRPDKYPLVREQIKSLSVLSELEQQINIVISPHGDVKDSASPELRNLRRSIQTKESQIRQRLDAILRSMVQKGYAQDDHLTLRDGHLVVPMKDSHAGQLKGMIVDQSSSGATLFVEPLEILEANNEIRRLRILEIREVERILRGLTNDVRLHRFEIESNFNIMRRLDALTARARYANEIDGCAAEIAENQLVLKEARHPLLLATHTAEDVVPLSLELGDDLKTLVITGPNAGGKTVALKTVGLLSVMHAYGLHVPAKSDTRIPLFSRIFADIGDKQSIEQDLSTFSSHIRHISEIIEHADIRSLILIDEIGSATDPAEGSALASTFLNHLTQKGCLTIATTHMGALKVFAHETPGVENGSMIFDQQTLQPTYRFQMGVPGSSYAFEIARRYGIPDDFIRDARDMLGEDRGRLDQLILTLEKEYSRTHALMEKAEQKDSQLSGLIALYQDRIQKIKNEADIEKMKLVEDAEKMWTEANATVERIVKEIREQSAKRESIQRAKREIQSARKQLRQIHKKTDPVYQATQGDWVLWEGHSGQGVVVSDPDRENRVLVQWGDVRLKVPVNALKPAEAPKKSKAKGLTSFHVERTVRDEIDLRGMTADEAIEAVEEYLGDAMSTGYNSVRIIHGKGTGVLRREIGNYLKRHRLVKSQRLGSWNEGDVGVTVVELK